MLLGVILIADGVGVLIWVLQVLLLPAYPAISYPAFALGFVAEVGLGLWLLIMGVRPVDSESGQLARFQPSCQSLRCGLTHLASASSRTPQGRLT